MAKKLLSDHPYPIGGNFITHELSPEHKGAKRLQKAARSLFAPKHVEPTPHTHSQPYSWKKALSAYAAHSKENFAAQWEQSAAFTQKNGALNLDFEVNHSLRVLSELTPLQAKVETLYFSGDCTPTLTHLQYLQSKAVLAINGGDSFLDEQHPSLTYVHPLTRYVGGLGQIYSSNTNENLYTHLWTRQFWGFRRVIKIFKRTDRPLRLKPINLYYHFYALEKRSSYSSLESIYDYVDQQALISHSSNLLTISALLETSLIWRFNAWGP